MVKMILNIWNAHQVENIQRRPFLDEFNQNHQKSWNHEIYWQTTKTWFWGFRGGSENKIKETLDENVKDAVRRIFLKKYLPGGALWNWLFLQIQHASAHNNDNFQRVKTSNMKD